MSIAGAVRSGVLLGVCVLASVARAADGAADSLSTVVDAGAPDLPPAVLPRAGDGGAAAIPVGGAAAPVPPTRARLRGRVLSKGNREPLAGASLTVDAVPAGEADASGRFEVEVPEGRRRLQIQHPGFDPLDVAIEASGAEQVFRMDPRLVGERYETIVTRPDERAPRTSLRDEELTRTPGSFGDPFRVVESLPGVSQVVWPLAIYAIRGANPGNTGFLVDGVRVPALFHFALGPSVLHPFFLQQLDFYPGGYPARYGRYVSGLVSARTATPPTDRLHVSADVRLFDAGGIAAAPWNDGKGAAAVAARLSYTGLIFSRLSDDYRLSYWDYQARVDHRLGPGKLTLFAFGSGDDFGQKAAPGSAAPPPASAGAPIIELRDTAEISFHRIDLRWDGALGGGHLEAGAVVGRDRSGTSVRQLVALPIEVITYTVSPRLAYTRTLAWWADLEAGVDGELQRFRPQSEYPAMLKPDVFLARDAISGGGFVSATVRTKSRLSVSPGLRYEAFFEEGTHKLEPSPRLTVRFRPVGEVWLKSTIGRFAQMASLPVSVPGFEGFGLRTYGTQTSLQTSLGVEAPLGAALALDATGYFQRLRLTDLRSMFNYDPHKPDILELRDGQSYGVEVMLRRALHKRLHGWLAYTLSWSERLVDGVISHSDWDQRHILNLVAGYRFDGGYSVAARFHWNTGRPYPVFDERSYIPEYQRLPAFYQLDLRGDKRFVFDRFVLNLYLELVNCTFTREVFDIRRREDGTLDEKGLRIVLPSIGVHVDY